MVCHFCSFEFKNQSDGYVFGYLFLRNVTWQVSSLSLIVPGIGESRRIAEQKKITINVRLINHRILLATGLCTVYNT